MLKYLPTATQWLFVSTFMLVNAGLVKWFGMEPLGVKQLAGSAFWCFVWFLVTHFFETHKITRKEEQE